MPGRFLYEKLPKYPHLAPQDVAVWELFITQNPQAYTSVDYDFRVGRGALAPLGTPDNLVRDLTSLTQKRIDAVGWHPDGSVDIIEVKPRANLAAIGEVISYNLLFVLDTKNPPVRTRRIIAKQSDPDVEDIAASQNIQIILV